MNRGEKSAVEAMLGLARPNYPTHPYPTQHATPHPLPVTTSLAPSLASPSTTTTTQPSSFDATCGSSVSPSLSPVQHKRPPRLPQTSDFGRPKAMRLSQLLTDDSAPDPSSFPTTNNCIPQQPQLSNALQLSLPPTSAPQPVTTATTATEPLTPPFSPHVLPPLSAVAGMAIRNENTAPTRSSWMPTPLVSMHNANTVLTNRNNMMLGPNTSANQVVDRQNSGYTTETMKKIVKRPYKKYYSNPTPSSHCHVCARTSKAVKFAICARIAEGLCRKVTCYKCFAKFGWDWDAAVNSKTWICVHCRGVCPEGRSQCYIYSRVNSKRESKRGKKAAQAESRAQDTGENGSVIPHSGSGLPSISTMGGPGVTSFSEGSGLHSLIRRV